MLYVIDTYAWVEYFIGSDKGEVLKDILQDSNNKLITPECCIGELTGWSLKNNQEFDKIFAAIRANSEIAIVTLHDWIEAGKLRFELHKQIKNIGMIDCIVLVKQKEFNAKIITGDKHFKNLHNVIFMN